MKSIMEEASSIPKAIETAWNRAGQPTEFSVKVLELPQTSFFGLKTSKSAKVAFFFNEATVTVRPKGATFRHETSERQHHGQQRPVTLRQPGNKSDDQRRPYSGQRTEGSYPQRTTRAESDNRQSSDYIKSSESRTGPTAERREVREPRELRDNRGSEQKQDQRNRPQSPRRADYTKPSDSRPGPSTPSTHPAVSSENSSEGWKNRSDASGRPLDRRPRYADRDSERSEHSSYSQEPRESWTPEMTQIAQEWIKETLVLMGKPHIIVSTHVSHNYLKVNLSANVLDDARQEETQLKSWGMLAMEAVREKIGKPLRSLRIMLEGPR